MRRKISRGRLVKFGIIGAAVVLAAGGVVAALPGAYAGSTGTPGQPTTANGSVPGNAVAFKQHRPMPAGARRVTQGLPKLGHNGPLFQAPISDRVVNGNLANIADYPWVVGIEFLFWGSDDNGPGWFLGTCTGTVLSSTKVLTAGHCVDDWPFGYYEVIAGRNTLPTGFFVDGLGGDYVGVSSTWTEPNFNLGANENGAAPVNDVAILTLRTPLPAQYTPVSLVAQGNQAPYAAGTNATIVGYGETVDGAKDQGTLHSATVPMVSDATCAGQLAANVYDAARMTCAGLAPGTPNAPDSCHGDSGGPLFVGGVEVGTTDFGVGTCGSNYGYYVRLNNYVNEIQTDMARPAIDNLDWTGDGHTDLLGRDKYGNVFQYSGTGLTEGGFPAFNEYDSMGAGWQMYNKLLRVTNWGGDGREVILAETPGGDLYRYDYSFPPDAVPATPGQTLGYRVLIGSGWNAFSDIVAVDNWNGDGRPSLLARTPGGDLWLYNSNGVGSFSNRGGTLIGSGWGAFDTVLTPGNWLGNGHPVLLGRTPAGALFQYEGNGAGGWLNAKGKQIGTGWNGFKIFQAPGDINGDDMTDVIGITPGGGMFLYTTDGHGGWITGKGQQIGAGWQIYNRIF